MFHYQLIKAFYVMQDRSFPDESHVRIIFDKIFFNDDKVTISFRARGTTRVCVFVPRGIEPLFKIDRVRDGVFQHFEE